MRAVLCLFSQEKPENADGSTLFSGAAEAAGTALRAAELIHFLKIQSEAGQNDQLGNAVTGGDALCTLAVIMHGDDIFPAVITVADAHAVRGTETLLACKAAAGEDGAKIALRHGEG